MSNLLSASSFTGNSTNLNEPAAYASNPVPSIIEQKKQQTSPMSASKTNVKDDLKKVLRVTVLVLVKLAIMIAFSSVFSYYCIISYAHLLPGEVVKPTDDQDFKVKLDALKNNPKPSPQSDKEQAVENGFFQKISIKKSLQKGQKPIPLYEDKYKNESGDLKVTQCAGIYFEENEILKQFTGVYDTPGLTKGVSALYGLSASLPDSYDGGKFIKYSIINFVQNLVILDFNIITSYFEFFKSFCSERFSVFFGWMFLIPFAFVFFFCHLMSTFYLVCVSVMDLFKSKDCTTENGNTGGEKCKEDDTITYAKKESFLKKFMVGPLSYFAPDDKETAVVTPGGPRKTEKFTTWETVARALYIIPSLYINFGISVFCALYALFKSLSITGMFGSRSKTKGKGVKRNCSQQTEQPSDNVMKGGEGGEGNVPTDGEIKPSASPDVPYKETEFSLRTYIINNLKFYSRGYLMLFTALLLYESYIDMNLNTAIGCVVAIIILVFGTSVFKKFTMEDDLFKFSNNCLNPEEYDCDNGTNAAEDVPVVEKKSTTQQQYDERLKAYQAEIDKGDFKTGDEQTKLRKQYEDKKIINRTKAGLTSATSKINSVLSRSTPSPLAATDIPSKVDAIVSITDPKLTQTSTK